MLKVNFLLKRSWHEKRLLHTPAVHDFLRRAHKRSNGQDGLRPYPSMLPSRKENWAWTRIPSTVLSFCLQQERRFQPSLQSLSFLAQRDLRVTQLTQNSAGVGTLQQTVLDSILPHQEIGLARAGTSLKNVGLATKNDSD